MLLIGISANIYFTTYSVFAIFNSAQDFKKSNADVIDLHFYIYLFFFKWIQTVTLSFLNCLSSLKSGSGAAFSGDVRSCRISYLGRGDSRDVTGIFLSPFQAAFFFFFSRHIVKCVQTSPSHTRCTLHPVCERVWSPRKICQTALVSHHLTP